MKTKFLFFVLIFAISFGTIFAQGKGKNARKTAEQRATQQSTNITKRLKLSTDQQKQVYDFSLAQHQQIDQERATKDKGRGVKIAQVRKDFDTKVEGILTADQKTKFTAMRTKQMEKAKNRKGKKKGNDDDDDDND